MSSWKLGKLEVRSGGKSSDGITAARIHSGVAYFRYGPPPGMWSVDPKSDWTIHQWMLQMAQGRDLVTDYEPKDDDMPKAIRSYIEACKENPGKPGQVF